MYSRGSHSRTTTASALSNNGQRANGIPPQRYYTVLSMETPDPFGFGSAAPARPEPRFADTPGPGKYNPRACESHIESIRGHCAGFTSAVPRRLQFTRGNKNPAPCSYAPRNVDRRIKPKIGTIPGRRCSCFPDESETSSTPGPGSYDLPPLKDRAATSIFKSKTDRVPFPERKANEQRFDGRTFTLRRMEL